MSPRKCTSHKNTNRFAPRGARGGQYFRDVIIEGQRDRNDATAAEASAAAANANAAAATANAAAATANDDAEEAQDTLGYQVRFTDALQTKIDELHALAYQVDPVAADAIKNRQN